MASPQQSNASGQQAMPRWVRRHALPVRISHWLNLLFLVAMLGSGLQIFNAHPALYWGSGGFQPEEAWLSLEGRQAAGGRWRGVTRLFGWEVETTGLFGVSSGPSGASEVRGFPRWATIPSDRWLAMGRRWHLFFAWLFVLNGIAFLSYALVSRHLSRDLWPGGRELRSLRSTLADHFSVRRLRSESVRGYNTLQKLSYLAVLLVLAPLIILTGLTMSPWLDSTFPGLLTLFDGRQSARSLHFIAAFGLVLFTTVHVAMVILVGPIRHTRAMITGWFPVREEKRQ